MPAVMQGPTATQNAEEEGAAMRASRQDGAAPEPPGAPRVVTAPSRGQAIECLLTG